MGENNKIKGVQGARPLPGSGGARGFDFIKEVIVYVRGVSHGGFVAVG
jgi:hypothetical protein